MVQDKYYQLLKHCQRAVAELLASMFVSSCTKPQSCSRVPQDKLLKQFAETLQQIPGRHLEEQCQPAAKMAWQEFIPEVPAGWEHISSQEAVLNLNTQLILGYKFSSNKNLCQQQLTATAPYHLVFLRNSVSWLANVLLLVL